jgi:predicted nucleic acid-binding protein
MKAVFADSFFFLAMLNTGDAAHQTATTLSRRLSNRRITTAWVLTEVGDAMSQRQNRAAFLELLDFLKTSPVVTIVPPSQSLFDRGIELFS